MGIVKDIIAKDLIETFNVDENWYREDLMDHFR